MKKVNTVYPTQEQLVELYDIIFGYTHSPGFKESEVKDFLFDDEYCINYEKPKEDWYDKTVEYLNKIGYNLSNLNIRPLILEYYQEQKNG